MLCVPTETFAGPHPFRIPSLNKPGIRPAGCADQNLAGFFFCSGTVHATGCRHRPMNWLRGLDLNQRPSGYEPDELPGCSTPRDQNSNHAEVTQIENAW